MNRKRIAILIAALIPLPKDGDECDLARITVGYTGHGDGLFVAAYRALTETEWTDFYAVLACAPSWGNYFTENGIAYAEESPRW